MSKREGVAVMLAQVEVAQPFPPPLGYKGSPTVLVNGKDLDPSARDIPDSGHG